MKRAGRASKHLAWLTVMLASRGFIGTLLGLGMWAVLPLIIGWQSTVVISGSMEPGVHTGDVIVAQRYTPEQVQNGIVKLGDVTLADNPAKPGTLITHRVIEQRADGTYITKGDANPKADSTPLPKENILGVERLRIPYLGIPLQTLRAGNPLPAVLFVLAAMIAQAVILKDMRNNRRAEAEKKSDDTDSTPKGGKKNGKPKLVPVLTVLIAGVSLVAAIGPVSSATGFSRAAFFAAVPNNQSGFNASADWTPPTVTMQQPASPLNGTVTVAAAASDANSGVSNTVIQYQLSGTSAWTTLCTVTASPYSCSWDTTTVADGNYNLRAIATDNVGLSTTSDPVSTTVANKMLVVLTNPGDYVKGTVVLATTLYNTGTVNYSVRVEYSPAGANSWKSICTGLASPYNCSWNTTAFTNGDYDLRSVAVSGGTTFTSAIVPAVTVDNTGPTVTMTDPGTPISGNWTFSASATDANSGVAAVTIQYVLSGGISYTDLCTFTTTPYSCLVNTLNIPNGTYTFRAVADDAAGNRTISAVVSNRVIDNTITSVSMDDPGAYLRDTVTLSATANSTAGVSSLVIQYAPAGTQSWTTVCSFTASPYSCSWNTLVIPNGSYDFRVSLTDGRGVVTTSATMAGRTVDNVQLRAFDIQTAAGPGTAGTMDQGDIINFTYNHQITYGSLTSGWNGSALAVTVRMRDGALISGGSSSSDIVDVQRSGAAVNLGTVDMRQDYIKNQKTATFNGTMTATTITVNGIQATKISITLGTNISGANSLRGVKLAAGMVWTPSSAVTDLNGMASSSAPVTESGTADKDF